MSLILEALKKLDREKQAPERGLVVVGTTAWSASSQRSTLAAALGALGLGAVAAGALLWLSPPRQSAPVSASPPPLSQLPPAVSTPASSGTAAPALRVEPSAAPIKAPPTDRAAAPAPTVPQSTAPPRPDPSAFHLTAISERDGQPVAILNDRLVREGDMFEGVRVLRIGAAEVEIEVGGKSLVIGF